MLMMFVFFLLQSEQRGSQFPGRSEEISADIRDVQVRLGVPLQVRQRFQFRSEGKCATFRLS